MSWQKPDKILVPVDFSEASLEAVQQARTALDGAEGLNVVYMLPDMSPVAPELVWGTVDDGTRRTKALAALTTRLEEYGCGRATVHIGFGDPGHGIADLAAELDVDLVLIPSHGRKGVSRFLLGSVAERVLRLSKRPVLVLKRED